jgi:hypothetical protein
MLDLDHPRPVLASGRRLVCAALLPALLAALLLSSAWARAADGAAASDGATAKPAAQRKSKTGKSAKSGPKSGKKKPAPAATPDAMAKRRRIGARPAYVVGDASTHFINETAPPIEPFPGDPKAFKRAFAETRRDQLADAEKAARDIKSPDRWRTVLFMLRGLPEHADPEACFWRVLAFYRLGEVTRGRTLREGCDLPAKDSSTLNAEDALVSGVPAMGTIARDDGFGPQPAAVKANAEARAAPPPVTAPYTGPSPQVH